MHSNNDILLTLSLDIDIVGSHSHPNLPWVNTNCSCQYELFAILWTCPWWIIHNDWILPKWALLIYLQYIHTFGTRGQCFALERAIETETGVKVDIRHIYMDFMAKYDTFDWYQYQWRIKSHTPSYCIVGRFNVCLKIVPHHLFSFCMINIPPFISLRPTFIGF